MARPLDILGTLAPSTGGGFAVAAALMSGHVWMAVLVLSAATFVAILRTVVPHGDARELRLFWRDRSKAWRRFRRGRQRSRKRRAVVDGGRQLIRQHEGPRMS